MEVHSLMSALLSKRSEYAYWNSWPKADWILRICLSSKVDRR
jgi:hypothetical protein